MNHQPMEAPAQAHYIEGVVEGKPGHILSKVLETGEPFFILRAKDIFSVMVIREYLRLIESYAPEDLEFQESLVGVVHKIKAWQKDNIDKVRYPD